MGTLAERAHRLVRTPCVCAQEAAALQGSGRARRNSLGSWRMHPPPIPRSCTWLTLALPIPCGRAAGSHTSSGAGAATAATVVTATCPEGRSPRGHHHHTPKSSGWQLRKQNTNIKYFLFLITVPLELCQNYGESINLGKVRSHTNSFF